ncbi:MAG: peptidase C39 family protein [Chloroflexota bacterium]
MLRIRSELGTPFSQISNLEQLGITVISRSHGTLEELYTLIERGWPVIVGIQTGTLPYWNQDVRHAVVVVGMDPESVYLHDPVNETSPEQIPIGEFDLAWLEHDERYAVLVP